MIFYFLAENSSNPSQLKNTIGKIGHLCGIKTEDIDSKNIYLIKFDDDKLSQTKLKTIQKIVGAYHYDLAKNLDFSNKVLNLARFGTQSPFSSKAYDILTHCGINLNQIEKGELWSFKLKNTEKISTNDQLKQQIDQLICDPMIHQTLWHNQIESFFSQSEPTTFQSIDLLNQGIKALDEVNQKYALALSDQDKKYLLNAYQKSNKNPSDVELMMFAVVNSEHCRHKIFNANFIINGQKQKYTLFEMIKNSSNKTNGQIITAYKDNSSIIQGFESEHFYKNTQSVYQSQSSQKAILMKVETHNHPTVISPFAGAATGSGGEIRDEGATGIGGIPSVGLCGFSVSNLHLPDYAQVWELDANYKANYPENMATSLQIMLDGPIGAASFNNEFGRANINGYFRSFEYLDKAGNRWGFHKPIMIAGGMGTILPIHTQKKKVNKNCLIVVLGAAALKIGIGGGSASSSSLGSQKNQDLDFSSVQRENPEAQRRCQEVINRCIDLLENNPIVSIHDVGAGGLSNAIAEIIHDNQLGADIDFRKIAINDNSMNPLEIWCNESQERYVIAIEAKSTHIFDQICQIERCPYQIVGTTNDSQILKLEDKKFNNYPVDIDLDWLFNQPEKLTIYDGLEKSISDDGENLAWQKIDLAKIIHQVLAHPSVGSKAFLVHIADRNVGAKSSQDQMIGAYQVPISDCAVSLLDYKSNFGCAMAMGERPALALIDAAKSARIATSEAVLNIAGNDIDFNQIHLSANWMVDCSDKDNQDAQNCENSKLYNAVKALGLQFCPQLSIPIPVGKDSLSMKMIWHKKGKNYQVKSPMTVNISAFAKVYDVNKTITSELKKKKSTKIIRVLISDQLHLGGSILLQTFNNIGLNAIDIEAKKLKAFLEALKYAKQNNWILAYHDISDGGLITALAEMQFSARCSLDINLSPKKNNDKAIYQQLFSEAPAVVLQVKSKNCEQLIDLFNSFDLKAEIIADVLVGKKDLQKQKLTIYQNKQVVFTATRSSLEKSWSQVSYQIKKMRDNPKLADQEFASIEHDKNKLFCQTNFDPNQLGKNILKTEAKIAIIREQGINGHLELAYAFDRAGFECVDVHMSELINGHKKLAQFQGLAFPGGFSYGDTFGAASGWANSILYHNQLADQFQAFFHNPNTFGIGFCNGSQLMSKLKSLIPEASHWPDFTHNLSNRFEARVVMVEVKPNPSLFFDQMVGSFIPVVVSHAEGRAQFTQANYQKAKTNKLITLTYANADKSLATKYPMNPNGSQGAVAGLSNLDGRFSLMMPHPERTIRSAQMSWRDHKWGYYHPWFKLFENARKFID